MSNVVEKIDDGPGAVQLGWLADALHGDPGDTLEFVDMYERRLSFLLGDAPEGWGVPQV